MATVGHDLRVGFRGLRRDWLVNLVAALSLALALAGNTTVFSVINAVLYRPLPYPDAHRIVLMGEREASAPQTLTASPANFLDWDERNRAFGDLAGFQPGQASIGFGDRPVTSPSARVSPIFFEILGANPTRGRTFVPSEGFLGEHRVAMVTETLLANRFPDLPDPVGATVTINGEAHTLVGVLPADFEFFLPGIHVWLPLALDPAATSRDERSVFVLGRLLDDVTMEQAKENMGSIWDDLVAEYPESNSGYVIDVLNYRHEIPNDQGRAMFGLVQGAVFFVLLIACVNIANLLSARGERRRREIALRVVLGAGRFHILRQLLVESFLLAALAGAAGMFIAWMTVRAAATSFAGAVPGAYVPAMEPSVLLFSLAVTLVAAILFGLVPAAQALRVDLAGTLKEGGRGATGDVRKKFLSRGLVVAEIAMSLVLLAGASMMVDGFRGVRNADPGFDDTNLLTVPMSLPVDGTDRRLNMVAELTSAASSIRGVRTATVASALPLNVFATTDAFTIVGRPHAEGDARPRALWAATPPDYLESLAIPMVRGRYFDDGDRDDTGDVAVVNETLAERFWPETDPIGERIEFRGRVREIVGIIGNTRQSLISTDVASPGSESVIFVPLAQQIGSAVFLLVRTGDEPHAFDTPLRVGLQNVHSQVGVGRMQTLDEIVDQMFVGIDAVNVLLTAFGYLALFLAAIGTYGVLAYNVAQRRQEIGVRVAVGARRADVVRMITWQGLSLGLIGVAIGAPFIWMLVRALNAVLQNLGVVNPLTAVAVAVVLLIATALASFLPALRASRMDPVTALRLD
ncbi:MAG: FtsX-like permease family protein [Acidobacteria bacterium]|nr:FtsX-like permease family protein [Acidobacteriota bacterium]